MYVCMYLHYIIYYFFFGDFIGIPTVTNLMATDNCLNVTASWSPITGPCSDSVHYMITLSSSSNDTIGPVMTSDTSYTFNNTVMLTGGVSVSVVAVSGNIMGTSIQADTRPSSRSKKFMQCLFCTDSLTNQPTN